MRGGGEIPRLRFPEFKDAEAWKIMPLGEIFVIFSGGTPNTSNKNFYNGDIPFIRSAEIDKERTELYLTQDGLNNSSARSVEKGDILIALYGANSGEVAIARMNGAINQAILCLKSEHSNVFTYHYFSHMKNKIVSTYLQGGQGNLSGEIIKSIRVPVPSFAEQRKIASCLTSLDEVIDAKANKLDQLKNHKKSLMTQLFPIPLEGNLA